MKKLQKYIMLLGFILLGMLAGILIGRTLDLLFPEGAHIVMYLLAFAAFVLVFYVAIMFQIALHEAGHGLMGHLTGYRFVSYRLLRFVWTRTENGIRMGKFSIAGTGGQCLMDPPEMKDGDFPVTLYNMGGSILNLISAVVFAAGAYFLRSRPIPWAILTMLALIGAAFAFLNGVPLRTTMVNNDGANMLELRRNPAARRAFWVQMRVNALNTRGVRLRDMPEEWFAVPTEEGMKDSMTASLAVMTENRLMDQRKFEKADKLAEKILKNPGCTPGIYLYMLSEDRIFCELIGENRPEVVKNLLSADQKKIMKQLESMPGTLRTEYAIELLHNRDRAAAEKIMEKMKDLLKNYPYKEEGKGELELTELAAQKAGAEEEGKESAPGKAED